MTGCRLGNDSRNYELLLTLTVLVAIAVLSAPLLAQNPPQSVGWKGANNVIAEQMWGNGTSRNYTGTQQDVNDAANAGIRWSRFVVYTAPDNACTDQEMQRLVAIERASGVNLMLDIQRLASSGRNCSGAAVAQTLYDPVNNSSDAQYTSWLANLVNQYKPYVHYYEVGNEENGTGDWKLVDEPTPTRDASVGGCTTTANYRNGVANYVQFLKDTYNTIKANDSTAKVIIGGLSEWTEECFIDQLASSQAWLYMDYMALHPYGVCPTNADCSGYPNSLSRLQSYKTHLAAWPSPYNNIDTWITEIGYYNKKDNPTWTLPPQAPDPTTEGTWAVNEMTMLHNNGITTPIFWYDLHEETSCDVGFGLTTRNNGSGKCATDTYNPVYSSFRGITDPASDLVIAVTPFWPLPTVNAGTTATFNVAVSNVSGFSGGNATLTASGLPSGATASFNPNPVTPGSSSTLSVTTNTSTPAGNYALTITAADSNTASGSALNSQVTLVVNASTAPDFTISATPSSQTVTAGTGTTYTASVSPLNGFTGTVSLSVSGLPSGATGTFNPTSISGGSGSSTLSVNTATTTPVGSYTLTITGTSGGLTHSTTVTLVVNASAVAPSYQVNSGGPAVSPFAADGYFSGGQTASTTATISTSGLTNPAPMAVYQTERWGTSFSYTFPSLTAGASYSVRLHFAEIYWTAVGQRVFNVAINGTQVLTNFDIIAAAGGANKANVQQFTTTANSSGQIVVSFTSGTADAPKSSGIEIIPTTATPDFTISATPASQTVTVGASTTYTVNVSPQGGFTGTVSLSVSGLPSGATGTFNPTSISGGSGSSTLTVATASTTPTGSNTLTITGNNGSLTHSTTVTLVVGSPSPIAFKQVNSNDNTGLPPATASSVAVTYTAAQTAGDLNVVVVGWNDTTARVNSVTDTKGNAYALAVGPTLVSGTLTQSIYYAKNIASAAANGNAVTVAFNGSAAYPDVRIAEYSGLSTSSPLDTTAAATGNSTNSDSGAATTSWANELLFGANTMTQTATGAGPGYTKRIITGDGDLVEDQIVAATGTYHATGPLSPAGAWIMQLVTFHQ